MKSLTLEELQASFLKHVQSEVLSLFQAHHGQNIGMYSTTEVSRPSQNLLLRHIHHLQIFFELSRKG